MKHLFKNIMLTLGTVALTVNVHAASKKLTKIKVKQEKISEEERAMRDIGKARTDAQRFRLISTHFTSGTISPDYAWEKLNNLEKLKAANRVRSTILKARILEKSNYPILASLYASQAIRAARKPLDKAVFGAWHILHKVSQDHPVQNIIEALANSTIKKLYNEPPFFNNDWNYYRGMVYMNKKKNQKAINYFKKLKMEDRYFLHGKFQESILRLSRGDKKSAVAILNTIVQPSVYEKSKMKKENKLEVVNYAHLALGRVAYEEQRFNDSIKSYRRVARDSDRFYEALFEQSWAFFMAGYPNHALGALHGVASPFFKDKFNPEAPVLEAIVYYWMCRYEDGRMAVANFLENNSKPVENLAVFLNKGKVTRKKSYQLFENHISGISTTSLGIPKIVLETAASAPSMMYYRDLYASILEERQNLKTKGVAGSKSFLVKPIDYLATLQKVSKNQIGKTFLAELNNLKKQYDRLEEQSEFLYVELLMSEKENLLGRELHASGKLTSVTDEKKVKGWGKEASQGWDQSRKGEYWWDEVGFYIYGVKPECAVSH